MHHVYKAGLCGASEMPGELHESFDEQIGHKGHQQANVVCCCKIYFKRLGATKLPKVICRFLLVRQCLVYN